MKNSDSPTVLTDSRDVWSNSRTLKEPLERNLIGDFHGMRTDIDAGFLKLRHLRKEGNLSDMLTKDKNKTDFTCYYRSVRDNHIDLSMVDTLAF